jgi:NADH-quinone oxidoreductase subunit L
LIDALHAITSLVYAAAPAADAAHSAKAGPDLATWSVALIPLLPLLSCVLCGLCAALKVKSKLPAWITVASLAAAFGLAVNLLINVSGAGWGTSVVNIFPWFDLKWGDGPGQHLIANFGFYVDGLTVLWMLFVTGLATLIALYASEYMSHDVGPGYCRFFAAFGLFVFSMSCLVMADNLLLLFLGWEGVGLCSYLLIGYFYKKPPAVAAAKKAFIINRIGDLGLVLGLMLAFVHFGTIEYSKLFPMAEAYIAMIQNGQGAEVPDVVRWIALLLAVGAFGKSAQLFFYVWLPDAMEGPTPVSALIHAATMVTAGVFLVARMYPLYLADEHMVALSVVAWAGAITAFWAATIEMAIFDIKRVMGYSTVSQLGFMFAGLGLLSPTGAAFHVFTHAFFKATLFLGVGAVMHGFGGQLDLRRLSGVMWMKGFGLVGIAMLIGSLNLSGVPGMAGYFSKDIILAQAFSTPHGMIAGSQWVAWLLLITAGMTAYYTFRTFMRVYVGPKEFVPGEDSELIDLGRHPKGVSLDEWHKQHGHGHGHGDHGHGHGGHADHAGHAGHAGHGHAVAAPGSVAERRLSARQDFDPTTEEFDPHPPGLAMKIAIVVCAIASVLSAGLYFMGDHGGWVGGVVHHSTAHIESPEGGTFFGLDPHKAMYFVSAGVGLIGILIAAYLHGPRGIWGLMIGNRERAAESRADKLIPMLGKIVPLARNKWYVDEFYDFLIRKPLIAISHICHWFDKLIVDGLVDLAGWLPRKIGDSIRPAQSGQLHGYAVGMAGGVAVLLVIVLVAAMA